MGDENPICTLGDYSKPSHEGYKNTIKLPVGNNVVPLRSDTIWFVQNGFSFHELRSEDPYQNLKDFLKLMDSLDLDGENWERTRLTQLGQQQDDMISKVNLLWKTVSEKLDDTPLCDTAGGPTAQMNFTSTDYHTKEELRSKGIKIPSKLLSPKRMKLRKKVVLSPAKLITQTAKMQRKLMKKLKAKRKSRRKLKERPKKKRKITRNTSTSFPL
ncbi:hypothetical protein Tco_0255691 [Tanacetum coccineum]